MPPIDPTTHTCPACGESLPVGETWCDCDEAETDAEESAESSDEEDLS